MIGITQLLSKRIDNWVRWFALGLVAAVSPQFLTAQHYGSAHTINKALEVSVSVSEERYCVFSDSDLDVLRLDLSVELYNRGPKTLIVRRGGLLVAEYWMKQGGREIQAQMGALLPDRMRGNRWKAASSPPHEDFELLAPGARVRRPARLSLYLDDLLEPGLASFRITIATWDDTNGLEDDLNSKWEDSGAILTDVISLPAFDWIVKSVKPEPCNSAESRGR